MGPLFEAFMEKAVADRLENSEAKVVITNKALLPRIPKDKLPNLETIIVVDQDVDSEYIDFNKEMDEASDQFDIEWLEPDDGLILHYTSGSTGQPKGVLHVQKAMLLHYISGKYVLDLKDDDIYWCTADQVGLRVHLMVYSRLGSMVSQIVLQAVASHQKLGTVCCKNLKLQFGILRQLLYVC